MSAFSTSNTYGSVTLPDARDLTPRLRRWPTAGPMCPCGTGLTWAEHCGGKERPHEQQRSYTNGPGRADVRRWRAQYRGARHAAAGRCAAGWRVQVPRLPAVSGVGSGRSRGSLSGQATSRCAGTREGAKGMAADVLDEVPVMNGGLLPPKVKECGMCHEVRPLSEFDAWHVGKNKTGTRRICRACEVPANLPYPQPGKESALLSTGMAFTMAALPALTSEPGRDELLLLLLRRLPVGQR